MRRWQVLLVSIVVPVTLCAQLAHAQAPEKGDVPAPGRAPQGLPGFAPGPGDQPEAPVGPQWNPRWRKAGFWDAVVVSVGSILYVGESMIEVGGGDRAKWDRPILWDSAVRKALRLTVAESRSTAGTLSDVMMLGSLVHNALFDNLVVAWAVHGEPELAWQMSLMNAEAYAVALSVTAVVKAVSARARPRQAECAADPDYSRDCSGLDGNRSFFSGHSAVTAVGAGLLCAHHLNVPLYDDGPLDIAACVVGIALTAATGGLRIASDNHWATDVTTGHLVGFASGFLIPTLLYYRERDEPQQGGASQTSDDSHLRAMVLPLAGPNFLGLQAVGRM